MKHIKKMIYSALIGLFTVSLALTSQTTAVKAAAFQAKPSFTAPREVIGYLNRNAANLPPSKVEQALWELERLWNQTRQKYESRLNSKAMRAKLAKYRFRDLAQFRNIKDPEVLKLLTDILADNLRLAHTNQKYYLKIKYAAINKEITRYAPQPVADYFRIVNRSQNISAARALKITPNELAKRIGEAENFLKNNGGFAKKDAIVAIYRKNLGVYLLGTAKTPAFTANKIKKNFLKSYQKTAAKYKKLPFGRIVTEYLILLKQNKYQKTKPVEDFIKAKTA
ncbi:MAG: hypothetical protein PVG90_14420 [Bacillota bacterium]|jgi:hypothetical protein